jgi:hypothetical protein
MIGGYLLLLRRPLPVVVFFVGDLGPKSNVGLTAGQPVSLTLEGARAVPGLVRVAVSSCHAVQP